MNTNAGIFRVYYCYAEEDEDLRNQLTAHLSPLRRARKLTIWFDVQIRPGSDWKLEIEKQLKEADLILLLISPGFIASDYCYNLQLTTALNHYEAGRVEIIPILLRPVLWEETPIKRLPLILPTSKLPVTLWSDRDAAFINVASAIRDLIQSRLQNHRQIPVSEIAVLNQLGEAVLTTHCPQCGTPNRIGAKFCTKDGVDLLSSQMIIVPKTLPALHTKEEWIKEGRLLAEQRLYADALAAYEQALLLDSRYGLAYFYKGHVLYLLQQYASALMAYEQAARFNPDAAAPHCYRGHTLRHLQRYSEALMAYEQALQAGMSEVSAAAWNGKGRVLSDLKKFPEALVAYEQAIQLNPQYAEPYVNKGIIFHDRRQYTEALTAYEKASHLDPHYTASHFYKGNVLIDLKQYREALVAYEQALQIDPYYAPAYHGKGRVYEILGLEEEAKEAFGKAASLNTHRN
jgi:tetratricopeptide (TPR) repeat protein